MPAHYDLQPGRLAVQFGPGQHAAAEVEGNRDVAFGQDVDLHLPGNVQRFLAFQHRAVGRAGKGVGQGSGVGIDLLSGYGPIPKLDVAIVGNQQVIGVLDARLRLHVVGHDDRIAGHGHRRTPHAPP